MSASNFDIDVFPIVRAKYVFSINSDGTLRNNGNVRSNRPKLKSNSFIQIEKKGKYFPYRVG